MKKIVIGIIMAGAALAGLAAPSAFTYQGVLKNEAGTESLTGNKTIELRLYNDATGGTPIWGRTFNVLLDQNGLFNVEVSDSNGTEINTAPKPPAGVELAKVLGSSRSQWVFIGLTVSGSSGEIAPRQKLLPVPYATVAADVSKASDGFSVGGTLTATNATIVGKLTAKSIDVTGAIGAATLSTDGAATIGGDLKVVGAITGYGTVPVGGIILWSGSTSAIPNGYALCNGQTVNGRTTPDLRGRFVVGAGNSDYPVGATGGEARHTLTVAEMPSHNHSYSYRAYDLGAVFQNNPYFYAVDRGDNWRSASTDFSGGGGAHENRPPYYALCYIMRVR